MNNSPTFCASDCARIQKIQEHSHQIISVFSHEVRNPVTLINSSLQFLEQDCPAVKTSPLWTQIREDMDDLIRLLEDMSLFNKSETLSLHPISAASFLEKVYAAFCPSMQEHHILFQLEVDPSCQNTILSGNEQKLKQVLTNLLVNAIDACSSADKPRILITLCSGGSPSSSSSGLTIHVKDNGSGIPKEYLSTVFDPFVTHKSHGTGLGLAISRNIIEQHHGLLSVETCSEKPDSYTDFSIWLPSYDTAEHTK